MDNGKLPPYHLASVDHALRLLLLLKSRSSIRVADAATELQVARSTAHRLLGALAYRGFALQDATTRVYRPGPVLVEIGMGALMRLDVRQQARPLLERLTLQTGETSSLMILEGDQCRFVDSIECSASVRVGSRAGFNLPAHLASGGKAMLAALPERILLSLYPDEQINRPPPYKSVPRRVLFAELERVRKLGYSINFGQITPDVVAIGSALCGHDGLPLAALTIAAPAYRMGETQIRKCADLVLAAVAEFDETATAD